MRYSIQIDTPSSKVDAFSTDFVGLNSGGVAHAVISKESEIKMQLNLQDLSIPKKALVTIPDFSSNISKLNSKSSINSYLTVEPEKAFVPAFDRSFHFGDSIYEVVRTYEGVLFGFKEHLRRLKISAELGMFNNLPDLDLAENLFKKTIRNYYEKFGNGNVYARITFSRGIGDLNIDPKYSSNPYMVIFVKELENYPKEIYEKGVHFAVVKRRRNLNSAVDPAMKSGNYLNNVLAIAESSKMGAQDALMLNVDGFVTEGTTNNFFYVKNNTIYTAPLNAGILAGITRDFIFEICKNNNIAIEERLFTVEEILKADEMFMSSSTKEIVPITTLNHKPVANGLPGKTTIKCMSLFKEKLKNFINENKSESLYI